jgi:hypothetical protein
MRLGIECTTCKDAIGRKHFRLAPYFRGTAKQRIYSLVITTVIVGMAGVLLLGMIYTDVPPQHAHVDLYQMEARP